MRIAKRDVVHYITEQTETSQPTLHKFRAACRHHLPGYIDAIC